jgi:hypothetical protein
MAEGEGEKEDKTGTIDGLEEVGEIGAEERGVEGEGRMLLSTRSEISGLEMERN